MPRKRVTECLILHQVSIVNQCLRKYETINSFVHIFFHSLISQETPRKYQQIREVNKITKNYRGNVQGLTSAHNLPAAGATILSASQERMLKPE